MRTVGIHLRAFPIPSEAFVVEQARTLTRHRPVFLVREILAANEFECREFVATTPRGAGSKIFAFAPGAWAWGGRSALADLHLIHAHFGPNGAYAMPVAHQLKLPLLVTFHGFDATLRTSELLFNQGVFGLYYILNQRRLRRRASKVIAVSKFLASRLVAMGFSSQQIEQHYIGVDLQRFKPMPAFQRSRDIVCVARLTHAKGIADLIRAFASVHAQLDGSKLRLIGAGPCRQEFESLAAILGVADQVVFHGTMAHHLVAEVVRGCALSVLASKTGSDGWQEAFGLASIEAAAAGLPVIVTKHGGLPETVVDNETGLSVAEGDVKRLASSILAIMRDDAGRTAMGEAGRKRVVQSFDLYRQTSQLEDIYKEAALK